MRFATMPFVLLCALAIIGGCGGKRDGAESESEDSTTLDLLPGEGDLPGWRLVEPGKLYVGEELCYPINGAAEKYFPFGFKEAAFGGYTGPSDLFEIQICLMGSPDDAYGVFSVYDHVNAEHTLLGNGATATISDVHLDFVKGPYFVRLRSVSEGVVRNNRDELMQLAKEVAGKIPEPFHGPAVLRFLPEGHSDGGVKYFRTAATQADVFYISDENVFSLSEETFGVAACYDTKTTEAGTKVGTNALYVIEYPTARAALAAFNAAQKHFAGEAYRVFGVLEGPEPKLIVLKGDEEFLKLNRCGNVVYGAWNIVDAERVNTLTEQLARRVRERTARRTSE